MILANFGGVLARIGRLDEGEVHIAEAESMFRATPTQDGLGAGRALHDRAEIARLRGDLETAEVRASAAMAEFESLAGAEHGSTLTAQGLLAQVHGMRGDRIAENIALLRSITAPGSRRSAGRTMPVLASSRSGSGRSSRSRATRRRRLCSKTAAGSSARALQTITRCSRRINTLFGGLVRSGRPARDRDA